MAPWRFWARFWSIFCSTFGPPLRTQIRLQIHFEGLQIWTHFWNPSGNPLANFLSIFAPQNRPHFHPNWGLERISRPRTLERRNRYKTNSFSSPRPPPSDPIRVQNWSPRPPKTKPKTGPHPNRPFSNFATKWDPNLRPTFASNSLGEGIQKITISGHVFVIFWGPVLGPLWAPELPK